MKVPYNHEYDVHNTKASNIIAPDIIKIFDPKSVLDVGCGLGTWLVPFINAGITDVIGVDGDYLDRNKLFIEEKYFIAADLSETISLNRKFDLVISLEVGEHLPETSSDNYIKSLVSHADTIIFSAAIPNQGGQNHINEQPIEYWVEKFEKKGYACIDLLRPLYWNDNRIEFWYRQNIFVATCKVDRFQNIAKPFTAYHPESFIKVYRLFDLHNNNTSVRIALRWLFGTLKRKILRK